MTLSGNHLTPAGLNEAMEGLAQCTRHGIALDLSSNALNSLPPALLETGSSLVELRLNMNPLGSVPTALARLKGLMHLGVARCGLSELPADIVTGLPRLETLDVARNHLRTLPPPASKSQLTRLFAAFNQLEEIDTGYLKLPLIELDLSHNELGSWPSGLGAGGILERIILHHNRITALPPAASKVASAEGLRELLLDHNCIETISGVTIECCDLSLSHNPLSACDLKSGLKKLAAQTVSLSSLGITALPTIGSRCEALMAPGNSIATIEWPNLHACRASLTILNLSNNQLTSLPEQIGSCPRLLELLVGYNRLSSLPASFSKLTSLVCLALSGNRFTAVPEPTLSMASLQWLWLSNNSISTLPPKLHALSKLQSLQLNDNLLTALDVQLPDSLLELDVSHNQLTELPETFRMPNGAEVGHASQNAAEKGTSGTRHLFTAPTPDPYSYTD